MSLFVDVYAQARANMIEGQLRPNKVTDPAILGAFNATPREYFVPEPMRGAAYIDEDLPLGKDRFLMEPMILARLLQAAMIRPSYSALEIGTGTGFAAAVLGRMLRNVVALESDPHLAKEARRILAETGTSNVSVMEGPLDEGYAARAPYNVILVSGAAADISPRITDQLAPGGVLIGVLRSAESGMGRGMLLERIDGKISKRPLFEAGTPYLPGFLPVPAFSFS